MRKDGKSQYQIKKEKLKEIKTWINWRSRVWEDIKNRKYKGDMNDPLLMPANLLNKIWEIVKDE